MEGILEAYHESLKTVQLYGPTNFAPVINHVARWVKKKICQSNLYHSVVQCSVMIDYFSITASCKIVLADYINILGWICFCFYSNDLNRVLFTLHVND